MMCVFICVCVCILRDGVNICMISLRLIQILITTPYNETLQILCNNFQQCKSSTKVIYDVLSMIPDNIAYYSLQLNVWDVSITSWSANLQRHSWCPYLLPSFWQ